MEPTKPTPSTLPAPASPAVGEPLVEFIRTQRSNAAIALGVLAVIFLAVGVYLALKSSRVPTATPDKPLTSEKTDPEKSFELPKPPGETENLKRGDFNVGWVACLFAFIVVASSSLWLVASVPLPGEAQQRTEARVLLLALGALLGAVLMLAGLVLFYRWSEYLSKWLDNKEMDDLKWVLIPVMMIVAGIGMVFAAIQPARAEERNNSSVRRIVYGSNFGLTVLLLLVALIVVNVIIAVKVPNKLDTTATGFYDLSDRTIQLLGGLKEPVSAYVILPEASDRDLSDIRQLMLAYQDAGGGKVKLKFLDPVANRSDLKTLRAKYPQLDLVMEQRNVSGAVLLTVGEDEKRHAVIPDTEFTTAVDRKPVFQGEARLFRELAVLADTDTKPIVYFTQSNGEMSIDPAAEAPDDQKVSRLRAYLEKNYLEVRPLTFTLENPSVPADAAVVVIAEPRVPFTPAAADAIRKYMNDPAKKGRLIVLAGIVPGANNQGVMKTGLEEVLSEMGVRLGNKFVYTFPTEQRSHPLQTLAGFTASSIQSKQEVAMAIAKATPTLSMFLPREVTPMPGGTTVQAMPLLGSVGVTWLEEDRIPEARLQVAVQGIARNEAIADAKDLSKRNRPLAVLVSQAGTPGRPGTPPTPGAPACAVYGNALFVSDEIGKNGSPDSAPISYDLIGVTIDWLRGRPSIAASGIEAKKYVEYQFPQPSTVDLTRLEYLPLALAFLIVVGLGVGVWFVRRR
ncbi:MAG: hypothetical protein C0467_15765 [Planctomycetaceae bacterium]|nr:hypothetical protein [Planctomycetaceae bacterium]